MALEGKLGDPVQVHLILTGDVDGGRLQDVWRRIVVAEEGLSKAHSINGNGSGGNGSGGNGSGGNGIGANGNGSHENGANGNGAGAKDGIGRLPWQQHDLRGLSHEEARNWVNLFLETDANQKISADRPPAMRFALVQMDGGVCELLWSYHPALRERVNVEAAILEFESQCKDGIAVERVHDSARRVVANGNGTGTPRQPLDSQPAVPAESSGSAAPDEVEEKLTGVWESVLNVTGINADDDFFDRGGHSLLAAKLLARIEDALGVELPLASLLEAPTIRGQAKLIREHLGKKTGEIRAACESRPREQRVVQQLPFFFLGGDPSFRPLSQRLSELRELRNLGLQASFVSKLADPYSLQCMAEHFVREIRERQNQGPYTLGGWCAHGLLAYEAARQLREQGQEVALVIMLESAHPVKRLQYRGWRRKVGRVQYKIHLLKFEHAYIQQLNPTQARDYVAGRVAQKFNRMKHHFRRALKLESTKSEGNEAAENPVEALYTAAARYCPKPYDGKVVLVRSQTRTLGFGRFLDLGWKDLLGDKLEICESPGNHYTIYMPPNVDALALNMNICLKKAEERANESASAAA